MGCCDTAKKERKKQKIFKIKFLKLRHQVSG